MRKPKRRSIKQWLIWLLYCFKKRTHWGYCCPHCGWWELPERDSKEDPEDMLECTPPVYNPYYSYEFGVTGYDWEETWQCRKCGTVFSFSNGSV